MRGMRGNSPAPAAACALVAALALAGCAPGQSPAERAIAAADSSWSAVSERVRTIAPQRAAAIDLALNRARASAHRGDWIGALAASQSLPGEIEALRMEIDERDASRGAQWDSLNVRLARALPEVDASIERVAASRGRSDVARARDELTMARVAWTNAVSAREDGRWDEAMQGAADARHRALRALEAVDLPATPDLAARPGEP